VSWAVGRRDAFTANAFMLDVADRLATRVQLTTDGHKPYLEAVEGAFGANIDYAMLIKMYEGDSGKHTRAEQRYSPAACTGSRQVKITGNPETRHISTSYAERANLDANEHAALHSANQCVRKEAGQPQSGHRVLRHVVQLRANPSDASLDARDGSGRQ
jgi:hypothetical protein